MLPDEWPVDLRPQIQRQVRESGCKVIVLDDDPTGTQTVHTVPVLTEWSAETLQAELSNDFPAFYILTNSRSFSPAEAESINTEIGKNLVKAARLAHRRYVVVSRSDSTLRGHFPGEVEALAEALEQGFDGWIINPFFIEGGRYTIGDIHYVEENGWMIPAGMTEFAGDRVFGYASSNLRHWVEEKTSGRISSRDVLSISIEDVRQGGPKRITELLMTLADDRICIANAAAYRDLEVFVQGLLDAEAQGRRFLYRTAASFVQVRAGLTAKPLLKGADLNMPHTGGGLIAVGSYVPKTTSQLNELLDLSEITGIEIRVEDLLNKSCCQDEIARAAALVEKTLQKSEDVVIYTSRKPVTVESAESNLSIGKRVSEGLIDILRLITTCPRYLIAKGGITSSDIATKALTVKRALVLGQILPGVPVWQLGPESRYPGMPYVVFPGNVGVAGALAEVVEALRTG